MDILEKMRRRRSVRMFDGRPLEEDLLHKLLEVGITAASGGNLQPFSIIVERDREKNARLSQLCGGQPFIKNAAVNLLFVMDWHKMRVYAKDQNAPFTCHKSLMHYLVAMQDIVCAAQSIESAAWLSGVGSCYGGGPVTCAHELVSLYSLPPLVWPVLLLSLGYPQYEEQLHMKKLNFEAMVFDGQYQDLTPEEICAFYEEKYGGMKTTLPEKEPCRHQMLETFERALETTYGGEERADILKTVAHRGYLWENQRRFGLHYHAKDLYEQGDDIYQGMLECGIDPFHVLRISREKS